MCACVYVSMLILVSIRRESNFCLGAELRSLVNLFEKVRQGPHRLPTHVLRKPLILWVLQTAGGVYLPDSKIGKTNEGEVIAVGPGRVTEAGTKIAVSVTVGDKVLLPEYGGTSLTLGDEELSLFRDEDILGKFQVRLAFQTLRYAKLAHVFCYLILAYEHNAFDTVYFSQGLCDSSR